MPRWLQAVLALALCVAIALWVQFKSVDSLAPALFALPATLMGMGYLSLNGAPFFLDLHLAAGLALLFLAVLRYWNGWRQQHWRSPAKQARGPLALWPLRASKPWTGPSLDRLVGTLEKYAPSCRVIVLDASAAWPGSLRWPELACHAAVVGPQEVLLEARPAMQAWLGRRVRFESGEPVKLDGQPSRDKLVHESFAAWAALNAIAENA